MAKPWEQNDEQPPQMPPTWYAVFLLDGSEYRVDEEEARAVRGALHECVMQEGGKPMLYTLTLLDGIAEVPVRVDLIVSVCPITPALRAQVYEHERFKDVEARAHYKARGWTHPDDDE
jgi:hypothetical protein